MKTTLIISINGPGATGTSHLEFPFDDAAHCHRQLARLRKAKLGVNRMHGDFLLRDVDDSVLCTIALRRIHAAIVDGPQPHRFFPTDSKSLAAGS